MAGTASGAGSGEREKAASSRESGGADALTKGGTCAPDKGSRTPELISAPDVHLQLPRIQLPDLRGCHDYDASLLAEPITSISPFKPKSWLFRAGRDFGRVMGDVFQQPLSVYAAVFCGGTSADAFFPEARHNMKYRNYQTLATIGESMPQVSGVNH
ncbi:hypothetical protein CVT26_013101 [Gymnopilus dilepis]|uniref:Uncharacterized protein n=1 Tax=Gymnopilus dilepis TaxID=231916 RepID=A0A409YFE6_9AGAR|nr:hypothetical protein CVT26_013101 [Gymnopilus dilepis]